jgi:hypothetical protein
LFRLEQIEFGLNGWLKIKDVCQPMKRVSQLIRWKGWYTGIGSTICPKCPTWT